MNNTNTLIEDESHHTIGNVRIVLDFLREFHHEHQFSKRDTSMNTHVATAIMLELVDDALSYESGKVEMMEQKINSKK